MFLVHKNRNFYRIKITGFPEDVDRASVENQLNITKMCDVPKENRRIAYVTRIEKRKEAIRIMKRLYDARYHGKPIKCQLEMFGNAHRFPNQLNDGRGPSFVKYIEPTLKGNTFFNNSITILSFFLLQILYRKIYRKKWDGKSCLEILVS